MVSESSWSFASDTTLTGLDEMSTMPLDGILTGLGKVGTLLLLLANKRLPRGEQDPATISESSQ